MTKKLQEAAATPAKTASPTVKGQCDDNLLSKNQDITLRVKVSLGSIFGPLSPYMPTSIEGELAMKRTDGKSDGYSISAMVDMATMPAIGPLRLADWGIVYETDGKAYTLTGSIHVILSISGKLHIYASVTRRPPVVARRCHRPAWRSRLIGCRSVGTRRRKR
jgi:hypothetical protein